MSHTVFQSVRRLQVWDYSLSHRQLLVRSNKDADASTPIKLQFLFVSEIHLPTEFSASEIVDVSSSLLTGSPDALREARGMGHLQFEIRNQGCVGYVLR